MKIRLWVLAGLIGCVSAAGAEPALTPDKGRILSVEGTVQVLEPGESAWKTPKAGAWLKAGSQVKTGAASSCEIGLGEERKSVIHLKENSQTKLQALSASAIQVDLASGSLFARVRDLKKESTFKVSSPTAIASVRGTGWEQSASEVNVFENSVEVAGSGGETMLVEEGFGVDIGPGGDMAPPEPVSADDKAEYESFESQAEQSVAQEASLPEDPGYEEPSSGEEAPAAEAAENETGGFDSFGENFGNEGFENPADPEGEAGGEDVLGEAKEEQQEAAPEAEAPDDDEPCVPNINNNYTC